jgi:hypothetical protein
MYYIKISGVKHEVNVLPDGTKTYDPPLTTEQLSKFEGRCKDMLKSSKPPGHRSDTSFHAGRGTLLDQLQGDTNWANHLAKQAKKRGVNLTGSEVYIGQLDDAECGNPDAFFKPGEGLSEMKRRLQKTGKGCDMPGLYVEASKDRIKQKALNPRVAKKFMQQYRQSGEASGKSDRELKEYVEKKHGRPVKNA